MKYVNLYLQGLGLTNQIFCLIGGIIRSKDKTLLIDYFSCDFTLGISKPISDIIKFDEFSKYIKDNYDITIIDVSNFDFELLNVMYGKDKKIDITEQVKQKYCKDGKLFIHKDTNLNEIGGDPCFGILKKLYVNYKLNGEIYSDEYDENLINHINYTNKIDKDNCIKHMWWTHTVGTKDEQRIGLDMLKNIKFNDEFQNVADDIMKKEKVSEKINVIHLRIEDDAIKHWKKINNLPTKITKKYIEKEYIKHIKDKIYKNDTTIILTGDINNRVIKYLNTHNYNYITTGLYYKYRELNAIIDFLISKKCNNVFIGAECSSFTQYIMYTLDENIDKKLVDLDNLLQ